MSKERTGDNVLVIGLVLLLVGLAFPWPFRAQYHFGVQDEAVVLQAGVRLLEGEYPYRDFQVHLPPGSFYVCSWVFTLFGPSIEISRILMLCNSAVNGLLLFLLARNVVGTAWAGWVWLLWSTVGVTQYPIVNHHWLALCPFLMGLLCLSQWLEEKGDHYLVLAGGSLAVTLWFFQPYTATLGVATCYALWAGRSRLTRKVAARWLGCGAGVSLLLWGPLLLHVSPRSVWAETVTYVVGVHLNAEKADYTPSTLLLIAQPAWEQFRNAPWSFAMAQWALLSFSAIAVWSFQYLGHYLWVAVGLPVAARARPRAGLPTLRLILVAQLFYLFLTSYRQDMHYVNFAACLNYILAAGALSRWRPGVWLAVPLACLYLAQYASVCVSSEAHRYPIHTYRGTLYTTDPLEAKDQNQLHQLASRLTPPGTRVFAYPRAQGFIFLAGLRNVRQLSLLPTDPYYITLAVRARQDIDEKSVRVIYRLSYKAGLYLSAYPTLTRESLEQTMKSFDDILLAGFSKTESLPSVEVYQR